MEQTFFIIKPDGVKRGLVGEVLKRIEQRGLTIEKLELRTKVSEELIDQIDWLKAHLNRKYSQVF